MQLIQPIVVHDLFDYQLLFSLESYLFSKFMFIDLHPASSITLLSTPSPQINPYSSNYYFIVILLTKIF